MHLCCRGEGDPTVVMDAGSGDWSLHLRPLQEELAGQDLRPHAWGVLGGDRRRQVLMVQTICPWQ
jgi:hypothetical protein